MPAQLLLTHTTDPGLLLAVAPLTAAALPSNSRRRLLDASAGPTLVSGVLNVGGAWVCGWDDWLVCLNGCTSPEEGKKGGMLL